MNSILNCTAVYSGSKRVISKFVAKIVLFLEESHGACHHNWKLTANRVTFRTWTATLWNDGSVCCITWWDHNSRRGYRLMLSVSSFMLALWNGQLTSYFLTYKEECIWKVHWKVKESFFGTQEISWMFICPTPDLVMDISITKLVD